MKSSVTVRFPVRERTRDANNQRLLRHIREPAVETPNVCVRHGLPGRRSKMLNTRSKPRLPEDDYPLGERIYTKIFGNTQMGRAFDRLSMTFFTTSKWEICSKCERYLLLRRLLSVLLFILPVLAFSVPVASWADGIHGAIRELMIIVGIALLIPFMRSVSTHPELTRAVTAVDGTALVVRDPHPDYCAVASAYVSSGD